MNKLSEFRKEQHKTMNEMAKIIGISNSLYIKVETGERNPSYSFLSKFKREFPNADINRIFFANVTHETCNKNIEVIN